MNRDPKIINNFIDIATNGEEAIKKFKSLSLTENERYFLIITDISMPVKDGY